MVIVCLDCCCWNCKANHSRCRTKRDKTWISTSPGNGMAGIFELFMDFLRQPLILHFPYFNFFSCSSATNRLITSKDHASVQVNVGHLGPDGVYTNQFTTFALCGFIRAQVHHFSFSIFTNCCCVYFFLITRNLCCVYFWNFLAFVGETFEVEVIELLL